MHPQSGVSGGGGSGTLTTAIATVGGATTGILAPGNQYCTVTSANADFICTLPEANALSIGTIINGFVGANGFELRVQAAQAATAYLNNVTTNVEAAIPANSCFKVTQITPLYWRLEVWDLFGSYSPDIIPD